MGELIWASLLHLWNDGLTAALTLLLPLMAMDLHLSYAQAAFVRTIHLATLAGVQIPIAVFAGAAREVAVLGGGLVWFGASYLALAGAMTPVAAVTWAAVAGIGAGGYHPVATNRIAHLADSGNRGRAVGTLNFAGDLGKFLLPAAAGAVASFLGWRTTLGLFGGLAALAGIAYLLVREGSHVCTDRAGLVHVAGTERTKTALATRPEVARGKDTAAAGWGIARPGPFALITAIGVIDNGIRSAALTFLPFLLVSRGLGTGEVGGLFGVMLLGGAAGKFVCGRWTDLVGERTVIIATEALMAAGLVGLPRVNGVASIAIYLLALGIVLNGTSSAVLTGVADTVDRVRGSRGYGAYFTSTFASGAIASVAYGVLADRRGLPGVFLGLGLVTLLIPVLALLLPANMAVRGRGNEVKINAR